MLLKRWLTSIIGIPILILLIYKGSAVLFALFIGLVMMVSLREYYYIVLEDTKQEFFSSIVLFGFLVGFVLIYFAFINSFRLMLFLLILNMFAAAVLSMPQFKNDSKILSLVGKEIQGVIYIPLTLSTLILLRNGTNGAAWVFFLLFIVFGGDSGAYYSGTYFGKHKLSPSISPGKTIEGAIGGVLSSLAAGYAFKIFALPELNPVVTIILIIVVNIFAQIGDLFESQLKRAGKIKDSGGILPGHGGLLDRIDGLVFAAPVIYFLKAFIISSI